MSTVLIWLLAGFALVFAEFFLTSFVVVFFGIAAIVVGIALWLGMPAHSGLPYLLFGAVSLLTLFGLRSRFRGWFVGSVAEGGVDEDFIGHEAQIESGFDTASPGRGRVQYRGASWDARSSQPELYPGSYARITARHGTVLQVEPAN